MKKFILPLLLLFAFGMLAAVESAPSDVVGYVKYDNVAGLNFIALPMDQGYTLASEVGDAYAGMMDAISFWDAATQTWSSAVYYEDFMMWDPDFAVAPGSALMVNALSPFSFYSIGDMPAANAQYSLLSGLNSIMVPLNKANLNMASLLGDDVTTLDAVSAWDSATQTWSSAVYYVDFMMWDPDFATSIGMPLQVNSLAPTTWPAGPRSGMINRNSK